MNISHSSLSFRIEIDVTTSFYFCEHFYKAFKDKVNFRGASVMKQESTKEVIGYCSECRKNLLKIICKHTTLSKGVFLKQEKF